MNTILVPLDGSTLAEQMLPTVERFASIVGARVHLVRVITDMEIENLRVARATALERKAQQDNEPLHEIQQTVHERAAAYLAAQAAAFHKAAITVSYEVRVGDPAAMILEVATALPATLIALATHGYGGLRRWALGSVSDKVVHAALVPVILVRATDVPTIHERPITRIVVPLDGSELAEQALPHGLKLAQQTGASLLLVTAVHVSNAALAWAPMPFDDSLQHHYDTSCAQLEARASALRSAGVAVETNVAIGTPAEVIVHEAVRQNADLIVMATHNYSGLRRWAAGSVTDSVLQTTTTPLLLVRGTIALAPHPQHRRRRPAAAVAADAQHEPSTKEE